MSEALEYPDDPPRDNGKFAVVYSQRDEIVAEICLQLAQGTPLTVICRQPGFPDPSTVWLWGEADPQVAHDIARARLVGHDAIADELLEIADDKSGDPTRDKLRVETRLKLLAKWNPKKYGDSTQVRHADADGGKIDNAPLVGELLGLMGRKEQVVIDAMARNVTPAAPRPSPFGPALIDAHAQPPSLRQIKATIAPQPAPRLEPVTVTPTTKPARPAYRPRGRSGVDDLV